MIQSGHNFACLITARLSWHLHNSDMVIIIFILEQHLVLQILYSELMICFWNGSPGRNDTKQTLE